LGQRLGDHHPDIITEVRKPLVAWVKHAHRLRIFAHKQRIHVRPASVAGSVHAHAVADPPRHLERGFIYTRPGGGRFDETRHPRDPCDRIIRETKREREMKHQFRIRRPCDVAE
jgi:hypothetical protein